jgi:peptidoglycan/xylan/chitin deacetylase (PgdA/CDA1 family)
MRLLVICLCLACSPVLGQEIAITFDDAPTADGPLFTGEERTARIIAGLKDHHVDEAAFFVMTSNINTSTQQRLHRYVRAGHLLANHSHSHQWIHQLGTRNYINDLRQADSLLNGYKGYIKWFRYPLLDEGRTAAKRDSIRAALKSLRLSNGYVTVDNYDWYLNHLLRQAMANGKQVNKTRLRDVYVAHIYNSIVFYDDVARKHLGRSPKHVLLLHENDLSALYLGDLISHLKSKGWTIISPRQAYKDPIASAVPDVLFNGQGRVAAIAREKGIPARELVQASEDEVYLDRLVEELKVFE